MSSQGWKPDQKDIDLIIRMKHIAQYEQSEERQRKYNFKRWVVDPQINQIPNFISYGEWHTALDELEERIAKCREMFERYKDGKL